MLLLDFVCNIEFSIKYIEEIIRTNPIFLTVLKEILILLYLKNHVASVTLISQICISFCCLHKKVNWLFKKQNLLNENPIHSLSLIFSIVVWL